MENNEIEELFKKNFDRRDNFKHIAEYIVAHHTQGLDDDRKIDVSADTALGMAIGEAIGRNKYLLTGLTIGALGTAVAFGIGLAIKRKAIKRYGVVLNHTDEGNEGFMFVEAIDEDEAKEKAQEVIEEKLNNGYTVVDAFEMS